VHLLVLACWHQYSATGCHGRQEKLGLGIAIVVVVRVLVQRWWWPLSSLSDTEARGSLLLLEWGWWSLLLGVHQWAVALILVLTWVVECGWVTHVIVTAGLQMVIISSALTKW